MTDETNFDFSDITRSAYIEPHRNSLIFVIRELQKTLPDDEYIQKFVGKLNGVDTKDWSVQEAVDMYNVGLSRAIHAVIQSITEKHIDLLEEEDSETIEAFMESILCMCYQTIDEHEDVSRIALSQRMTLQAIKLEGKSPEYKAFIKMALYIANFFYTDDPCSKETSFIAFTAQCNWLLRYENINGTVMMSNALKEHFKFDKITDIPTESENDTEEAEQS